MMNGILVIDKPAGPTSHDVVASVRRSIGIRKIGHTGTLDPFATGVLPLVVGRATRLASLLTATDKEYVADIRFGAATDTYDATGRIVTRRAGPAPARLAIEQALAAFRGTFPQLPPPFSAKHVGGARAYSLARQGAAVQPAPVTVTVHDLTIRSREADRVTLHVTCSSGFYVRSLAHALGERLAHPAHLCALRRIRSGPFGLDVAVPLDTLVTEPSVARVRLVPMARLQLGLPEVVVTDEGARRVTHGRDLDPRHLLAQPTLPAFTQVRLLNQQGALLAIAETRPEPAVLHPTVVLV